MVRNMHMVCNTMHSVCLAAVNVLRNSLDWTGTKQNVFSINGGVSRSIEIPREQRCCEWFACRNSERRDRKMEKRDVNPRHEGYTTLLVVGVEWKR